MSQKLRTAFKFAKNFFVTGAIMETSRRVEIELCRYIPKDKDVIVVEFGMGHGNITKEILKNISSKSQLYAFEVNKDFCEHVKKNITDERLIIINDGAENIKKHIKGEVHSVIASIPFSFFSKEKGMGIIQNAYDLLEYGSIYSQVLYTKFNFKKFQAIFEDCRMIKVSKFPAEFIYHCKKKENMPPPPRG